MAAELGARPRIRVSEIQPPGGRALRAARERNCGEGLRALGEAAQTVLVVIAVLWLGAIGAWLGG